MTINGYIQVGFYLVVLLLLVKPMGLYMARVYEGQNAGLNKWLAPVERVFYRVAGVSAEKEMSWKIYALAVLIFNLLGLLVVYLLQRLQGALPLNPQAFPEVTPDSSFNTAISFASNTNWQGYGGESTMSYLTQMLALTVQNFISAATGMAVLVALIRGIGRRSAQTIGNFWVDMTRSTIYILLPLSIVLAIILMSQGVVQTFDAYKPVTLLQATKDATGNNVTEQLIAVGPAASQIAIKQIGTNGGGFFNANSAHPLENPNALANFLEVLSILLIPAALCYTFGKMVNDTRQGWAVLAVMTVILVIGLLLSGWAEQNGNPALTAAGASQVATDNMPGGNMEGKEARYGITNSTLWATTTSAASNGSVNSMHDSYTPLGGLIPMLNIQLGEVVFGGVGSGLYGMLVFAIIAVFIAGLLVGRTPEYLGKKIEAYEMKMAALVILIPPLFILAGTALAVATDLGRATIYNPATHGFSEVLYAFSSATGNNGSAFAGLGANNPFYNTALGFAMLFGRFWVILPVLAIAGSLAAKKQVPAGAGTLPTHTPLFVGLLVGVVIIVGALTFLPALALGPVVEHLQLFK